MTIADARTVGSYLLGYPFRFEVTGLPPFLVRKCKIPGVEFEVVETSGGGQTLAVKQAGGEKVGEGTLEVVMPATGEGRGFFDTWRKLTRTRDTKQYYKDATVTLLGPDDAPSVIWDIQDMWLNKPVEWDELDTEDKKKLLIGKVTFQCYDVQERWK